MVERLEYRSENGYRGVMYGKQSFCIYNEANVMVLHSGSRAFNDYEGLKRAVDGFPELMKVLAAQSEEYEVPLF